MAEILQNCIEHERAAQQLRQLQQAVENLQVGLTISDLNGVIVYTNPAEAGMHGYTRQELLGKEASIFAPHELRRPFPVEEVKTLRHRERESVNLRKDGSTFPVQLISDLILNSEGEASAIITICEDITERKKNEEALRMGEQQYRLLAESVADGIGIILDARLVFANKALAALLGVMPEQLVGESPEKFFCNEYKEHFSRSCERLKQQKNIQEQHTACMARENNKLWIEAYYNGIVWEGQDAVLLTIRDITEHKLHELALEEEKEHLERINMALRSTMKDRYRFGDIIGKSRAIHDVFQLVASAATTDANVLISGESGTGKELIAWTIHYMSDRKDKVFVPVNCGAVTESLFESEFFGHRKGAFTGAHKDKRGFFDYAHGGTLFLDEVGELSLNMQAKLLRVLAGSGHMPVGDHTIKKANVRILAATNRNLEQMVKQGNMREDFFFRIHVVPITVPPLRERREDIPLLLEHFLDLYSRGESKVTLPGPVLEQFYSYDWPGNIRELQNMLQRYLATRRLNFPNFKTTDSLYHREISGQNMEHADNSLRSVIAQCERQHIAELLQENHGHRGKTADMLGITRRSLNRKLNKYQLE